MTDSTNTERDYPPIPDLSEDSELWCAIGRHRRAVSYGDTAEAAEAVDEVVRSMLRAYVDADRAALAAKPLPAAAPVNKDVFEFWWADHMPNATQAEAWAEWVDLMQPAAPQPAVAAGWVSVDERLPEPNVEVLCAGKGWGDPYVTACYYDDERREWYQINTHWTDATACAQYPTHWQPLPPAPIAGESNE